MPSREGWHTWLFPIGVRGRDRHRDRTKLTSVSQAGCGYEIMGRVGREQQSYCEHSGTTSSLESMDKSWTHADSCSAISDDPRTPAGVLILYSTHYECHGICVICYCC